MELVEYVVGRPNKACSLSAFVNDALALRITTTKGKSPSPTQKGRLEYYKDGTLTVGPVDDFSMSIALTAQLSPGMVPRTKQATTNVLAEWDLTTVENDELLVLSRHQLMTPAVKRSEGAQEEYFKKVEERLSATNGCYLMDRQNIKISDLIVYYTIKQLTPQQQASSSTAHPRMYTWITTVDNWLKERLNNQHPIFASATHTTGKTPSLQVKNTGTDIKSKNNDSSGTSSSLSPIAAGSNFIKHIIEDDLRTGKHTDIVTRFPPEPNGFLHLGHAKSICLNFGLAKRFNGRCNLRFDDTNPTKEETQYIESIIEDVKWMGGEFPEPLYASDYFDQFYHWALDLIDKDLAYIDRQTEAEVRANRGDLNTPGVPSPWRDTPKDENRKIFEEMKSGVHPDGKYLLRAKIDMKSGNMNLRDPPLYRIKHAHHPRTGDTWCIYPMYDFAHGQEDSIERITHSICTLEFEDHRPLYDWYQEKLDIFRTRQIEFARLNVTNTVMSKRKLLDLVQQKMVEDWDDPRMPTISGMRRRGFPASAIQDFCERVGVAKRENVVQFELLESCVRDALKSVIRRFLVLNPIRVVITNFPDGQTPEDIDAPNHPENAALGSRKLLFGRTLYIDSEDFMETPTESFHRLTIGSEVRLKYCYWIRCMGVIKDNNGNITELHCEYDPSTKAGIPPADGRKVKATIHWLHAESAVPVEARLYEKLILEESSSGPVVEAAADSTSLPVDDDNTDEYKKLAWLDRINPRSLQICNSLAEPSVLEMQAGASAQFERVGFFVADRRSPVMVRCRESCPEITGTKMRFNRTVQLVDTFAAKHDLSSDQAQTKETAKVARAKAAAERERKKEEKLARATHKSMKAKASD
eukprot:Lankesteria_metandrocarpae@DN3784_c0_g1_i1.p1